MAPLVVDKAAKKREILAAALSVFAQKGVKKAKMAEIAVKAGIGKGTIYEYFTSKDEVLTAAFEYFIDLINSASEARIDAQSDPERQFRAFIQGTFDAVSEQSDMVKLMFHIWAEGLQEGTPFDLKGMYERYRIGLEGIIASGMAQKQFRPVVPRETAAIVIAAMDGLLLQWVMDPALFNLAGMGATLADTLLQGIRAVRS